MARIIRRVVFLIATLAVTQASLGQSSVATADESGALLNIVRQFLERAGGTVAQDPAAETRVLGRLGTLRPVVEDDNVITFKQACNALNYGRGVKSVPKMKPSTGPQPGQEHACSQRSCSPSF
jgi:hypothetical protein